MNKNTSVIIVTFNTSDITLNCIKSIYNNDPTYITEMIIVDNGSEDDTLKKINDFKKENQKYNIKIIENRNNLGFSKAVNQAIKISSGNYILLINSDIQVNDRSISKMVDFAESRKDVDCVSPKLLNKDGSVQGSVYRFPTITKAINQYWLKTNKLLDKYTPQSKDPVKIEVGTMAVFLIKREVIEKIGMLDERYFMYFEDFDFCRRLKKNNLNLYFYPAASFYHFHGKSGEKMAKKDDQWKRLIPSSKIYHGLIRHYIINFIIWSGNKIS